MWFCMKLIFTDFVRDKMTKDASREEYFVKRSPACAECLLVWEERCLAQRWEVQSIFARDPLQRSWMFACVRRARRPTLGPDVTRSSCSSDAATQIWTSGIICKSKKFSCGKEEIGQNHFHLHLIFKAQTWYHKDNHSSLNRAGRWCQDEVSDHNSTFGQPRHRGTQATLSFCLCSG